ncbi:hypothetical protein Taro_024540 [Colocasia esculenta]|uniref:NAC domain-containing protein n=1 Tax=Colocasia esculenta TaxID=4460 RepID=A0A843VBL0_COLES|nr:hypothetical protein [Colocasia esculenta]
MNTLHYAEYLLHAHNATRTPQQYNHLPLLAATISDFPLCAFLCSSSFVFFEWGSSKQGEREGEGTIMAANPEALLPPGFRFHPTDEELIHHYLRKQATSLPCPVSIIAEVDIYKFDPWDLPAAKAAFGDREWYFFTPRDRKYPNGVRPNRAAASGYWKATGTDKPIVAASGGQRRENIGVKKALVFYKGRPPKGLKTNWIMHEYRLADAPLSANIDRASKRPRDSSMRLDDWVLCRIYKKNNNQTSSSDRDYEDSSSEDAFFLPHPGGAAPPQSGGKLPKTASLSDLFNDADFSVLTRLLHENTSDMADADLGALPGQTGLTQPFLGYAGDGATGFSVLPKLAPMDPPALPAGTCFKRQRAAPAADYGGGGGGVGGQAAAPPQCNILSQPFLHEQIMLNSRFGFP